MIKAVRCPIPARRLRDLVAAAASQLGVPAEAELAIRITGDRELRRLNRSFLGIDASTDVLSFPSGIEDYLGDIAISWPAVIRQAAQYGHSEEAELALLCVHGLLHLLGRDHDTPEQERAMWAETHAGLAAAGVPLAEGRLPQRS